MKNKKQAFTLAEVLLVLAIIGVIAAVTIPAIMQQSSEKKFSALAKKAQSTLQNAIDLKIATAPIGPGDMGVGILQWLLDGEDDGTNTLKAVKQNSASNPRTIQTPDGMIYNLFSNPTCNTPSSRQSIIGCYTGIFIDLNGTDPPTKTTIDNATGIYGQISNDKKAYDTILLYVQLDAKVRPCNNNSLAVCTRPVKYLGIAAN